MATGEVSEFVPIGGGCLCKNVRYQILQPPMYHLMCLCTECQAVGGGFGQCSLIAPKESIQVVTGNDFLVSHTLPESTVTRKFCKACGTHIIAGDAEKPVYAVHAGTLDNPDLFKPQVAIWCQNKRKHFNVPEGIPCFPQYPPPA